MRAIKDVPLESVPAENLSPDLLTGLLQQATARRVHPTPEMWQTALAIRKAYISNGYGQELPTIGLAAIARLGQLYGEQMAHVKGTKQRIANPSRVLKHHGQLSYMMRILAPPTRPLIATGKGDVRRNTIFVNHRAYPTRVVVLTRVLAYIDLLLLYVKRYPAMQAHFSGIMTRYLRFALIEVARMRQDVPPELLQRLTGYVSAVLTRLAQRDSLRNVQRCIHILQLSSHADLPPPPPHILSDLSRLAMSLTRKALGIEQVGKLEQDYPWQLRYKTPSQKAIHTKALTIIPSTQKQQQTQQHVLITSLMCRLADAMLLFEQYPKSGMPQSVNRTDLAAALYLSHLALLRSSSTSQHSKHANTQLEALRREDEQEFLYQLGEQRQSLSPDMLLDVADALVFGSFYISPRSTYRKRPRVNSATLPLVFHLALRSSHFQLAKALYLSFKDQFSKTSSASSRMGARFVDVLDLHRPTTTVKSQSGSETLTAFEVMMRWATSEQQKQLDPMFAVNFWRDSVVSGGFKVSQTVLSQFLPLLASVNNVDLVVEFLSSYRQNLTAGDARLLINPFLERERLLPILRVFKAVRMSLEEPLSMQDFYHPVFHMISVSHPNQIRLMQYLIKHMPHDLDSLTFLFLLRCYSRRWNVSPAGLERIQTILASMSDYDVVADERHRAEVMYACVRLDKLAEAKHMFLEEIERPWLVSTDIVGILICRLADRGLCDDAERVVQKWLLHNDGVFISNNMTLYKMLDACYVSRDERKVVVASKYLEARRNRLPDFDWDALNKLNIKATPAIKRLSQEIKRAYRARTK